MTLRGALAIGSKVRSLSRRPIGVFLRTITAVSETIPPASLLQAHDDRLLVVAEEKPFIDIVRRACEVAFEGDCVDCIPDRLDTTLRQLPPSVVIVHADGRTDRACAMVSRIKSRSGLERVPMLAIGAALSPLDRWLLGAAGAFAVLVPSPSVDVIATVIEETLSYAKMSGGVVDPSRTHSHMHLGCDHEGRLPIEAFLLLIAGAWSSGTLPENTLAALIDAALENGHNEESLQALERACEAPIPLVDVDVTDLLDDDRWYLYAFALWMALGTSDVLPRFSPTLQVLGHTLGVAPRLRPAVQGLVERARREGLGPRNTFRRADFFASMLPELEVVAGFSVRPPPPEPETTDVDPFAHDDDVMEMPDDAMIDDALHEAS